MGPEQAQPNPYLRRVGLPAGYNGVPVVHDLDLVVHPGEIVALLGPNGAGKSTTLFTLSGLYAPIAGEIWWNGARSDAPCT